MIEKIISGGQTGADRAALDFAIYHDIPHGGWCPKGRLAEDGPIEHRYLLQETSTRNYPQRTEKNVQDSDGTLIFSLAPKISGGSKKTAELAARSTANPGFTCRGEMTNRCPCCLRSSPRTAFRL